MLFATISVISIAVDVVLPCAHAAAESETPMCVAATASDTCPAWTETDQACSPNAAIMAILFSGGLAACASVALLLDTDDRLWCRPLLWDAWEAGAVHVVAARLFGERSRTVLDALRVPALPPSSLGLGIIARLGPARSAREEEEDEGEEGEEEDASGDDDSDSSGDDDSDSSGDDDDDDDSNDDEEAD